jgi:hypothetical protein
MFDFHVNANFLDHNVNQVRRALTSSGSEGKKSLRENNTP